MNEWGRVLIKIAVLHDLFSLEALAGALRSETEWDFKTHTLGQYLKLKTDKNQRNPPPDFFDQVRRALNLSENMYNLLLYVYHESTGEGTPLQRERIQMFEGWLLERAIRDYGLERRGNGVGGRSTN